MGVKHEAKLTVRAALKGFGPEIDFQQTEAVCVMVGRQAAGAGCQDVCSYFPQSKIRPRTFSYRHPKILKYSVKGSNNATQDKYLI